MKMNTQNFRRLFLACAIISVASCTKDEAGKNTDLNSLQPVKYDVLPDVEKSAVETGVTAVDPNTGLIKKEYLVKSRKSASFSVAALMKDHNIEQTLLYPGSILRGSSYMDNVYDPLVLTNSFKPVALFLNIKGTQQVSNNSVLPKGSAMFQAISDLKIGNSGYFPTEYIPGNYSFESTEITNEESFKKSVGLHVKASYGILASASFGYDSSNSGTNTKKYIMMKLKQTVYSAGIDPVNQANWIDGGISTEECGSHEPVYISSID